MNNRQVLEQLRKGSWVDASAALRAIDRRDEAWNPGRQRHRGETIIPEFAPLPLPNDNDRLRPEGTRREGLPNHAHVSLK